MIRRAVSEFSARYRDDPDIRLPLKMPETSTSESNSSKALQRPSLRALDAVRPLYFVPTEPFAEKFLIPAFKSAAKVDCMVGFFSSEILAALAPSLATYINFIEAQFPAPHQSLRPI
jgi:hypothetical protein